MNRIAALLLVLVPASAHAGSMSFPQAGGGGGPGVGCLLAGDGSCQMTGDARYAAGSGVCVGGDPDLCMIDDGADGYVWLAANGVTELMSIDSASLFTADDITAADDLIVTDATQLGTDAGDVVTANAGAWAFTHATSVDLLNATATALVFEGGLLTINTSASTLTTGGNTLLSTANGCALAGCTMTGGITFSAVAVDITSGTNEDIAINPDGTGDVTVAGEAEIVSGTLAASEDALLMTATAADANTQLFDGAFTMPNTAAALAAFNMNVTTTAGTNPTLIRGGLFNLAAGSTTGARTIALQGANAVAGTGTLLINGTPTGNLGVVGSTSGAGAGHTAALWGHASGSTARNVGGVGLAITTASTDSAGLIGFASAGTNKTGGIFQINSAAEEPLNAGAFTTAGLIASNGDTTSPIAILMDDATAAWIVQDGGDIDANNVTNSGLIQSAAADAANPTYAFNDATAADDDTGMFSPADEQIGFSIDGTNRVLFTGTVWRSQTAGEASMSHATAAVGNPSYGFNNDEDTGMWNSGGSGQLGFVVDGVEVMDFNSKGDATITSVSGHTASSLTVTGGSLASGTAVNLISGSATLNTGATDQRGVDVQITAAAAGPTFQRGATFQLLPGASAPSTGTQALFGFNTAVSTGTGLIGTSTGNFAVAGNAAGVTATGSNAGMFGIASGSSVRNVGVIGRVSSTASTDAFGVIGFAAAGTIRTGMLSMINSAVTETLPISSNSGFIASNGDVAADIAQFKDNTTTVFTIADGGAVTSTSTIAATRFDSSASQSAACAAGVLALTPTSSTVYLDANAAACVVTVSEPAAAFLNDTIRIVVFNLAAASAVTFPNSANVIDGPTLCASTGFNGTAGTTGVYELIYADLANDALLGVACTQNL